MAFRRLACRRGEGGDCVEEVGRVADACQADVIDARVEIDALEEIELQPAGGEEGEGEDVID